jgi:hypothetical protein
MCLQEPATEPLHTSPLYFKVYFNIASHLPLGISNGLFHLRVSTRILNAFDVINICHEIVIVVCCTNYTGPKRDEVTGGWRKLHNE